MLASKHSVTTSEQVAYMLRATRTTARPASIATGQRSYLDYPHTKQIAEAHISMCWYRQDIFACGHVANSITYLSGHDDPRYVCTAYQARMAHYQANVGRVGYPARCPPFGRNVRRHQLTRKCQDCVAQEVVKKRRDEKDARRKFARDLRDGT